MSVRQSALPAAVALLAALTGCAAPPTPSPAPTQSLSANGSACLTYEAAQNKLGLLIAQVRRNPAAVTAGSEIVAAFNSMTAAAGKATGPLHDHLLQAITALPSDPTQLLSGLSPVVGRHAEANQAVKADCAAEGQTITPMDLGAAGK